MFRGTWFYLVYVILLLNNIKPQGNKCLFLSVVLWITHIQASKSQILVHIQPQIINGRVQPQVQPLMIFTNTPKTHKHHSLIV